MAVQCNIAPEQVESDCRRVAVKLEELTVDEDNHFTEYDILCALRTYHTASEQAYRRKIDIISDKTGIQLTANKRNGRKQEQHLQLARGIKQVKITIGEGVKGGRPEGSGTAQSKVQEWQELHPYGKKSECIKDTGLSKPTVYKWWT